MIGYRHKMSSNYIELCTYYMDHFSFLQILTTQQITTSRSPGYLAVGQRSRPRVHIKTRDHLGQEDHLLLSSSKYLNSDILYT